MTRKYRNRPQIDREGIRHASKLEQKRWQELNLLSMAGAIKLLERQVRFPLIVGKITIGRFVPDFCYVEGKKKITEDAKGFATPLYKWKRKHFEAQYPGVEFREVRK